MDESGGRLTSDPNRSSLGLLPSGPDPVGEWLVHRQPPGLYIGGTERECKRRPQAMLAFHRTRKNRKSDGIPDDDRRPRRTWSLHPQLAKDTINIGDLPLSRVLVINDANYPWLLLVPRRIGVSEMHRSRRGRAGAIVDRDRARRPRAQDRDRVRQAQHRGARQCGAATACARDRAPRRATPPGRSRSGARCRRSITTDTRSTASLRSCGGGCGWSSRSTLMRLTCCVVPPAAERFRGHTR